MKIQKGHYVPKELITSEAIHEAVVKCFVAAGFFKDEQYGNMPYPNYFSGLGVDERSNRICWTNDGEPIALQQLFIAENGLQWPEFATEIRTDDNAVWFFGGGHAEHIFGSIQPVPHRVLSTRQPKEKKVNEALDKAVIELSGLWPDSKTCSKHEKIGEFTGNSGNGIIQIKFGEEYIEKPEFTQHAKELGFINGYRWGVEYETNGKRPELADDVVVSCKIFNTNHIRNKHEQKVDFWDWDIRDMSSDIESFRITDQRYKPADTSYLENNNLAQVDDISVVESEWYDYENQRALRLPDVGTECLTWFDDGKECWQKCKVLALSPYEQDHMAVSLIGRHDRKLVWANNFKPLDHATRKAELEKKRVIASACEVIPEIGGKSLLEALYDAGYLRLPDQK